MGRTKEKGDRKLSGWAIEEEHLQQEVCRQRIDNPGWQREEGNTTKSRGNIRRNESVEAAH